MEFRKLKESNTWHCCENCGDWPTTNFDSSETKPTSGNLCDECVSNIENRNWG